MSDNEYISTLLASRSVVKKPLGPLFPGHVPLTDLELFQAFNVETPSGGDLWCIMPRWGQETYIDDFEVSDTIKDNEKEARIAKYAILADLNLPLFAD